jgi:hypothetical protein
MAAADTRRVGHFIRLMNHAPPEIAPTRHPAMPEVREILQSLLHDFQDFRINSFIGVGSLEFVILIKSEL